MTKKIKKHHPFKNNQMPFHMRIFFAGIKLTFKVLGAISPKLAGKLALYFFMKTPKPIMPRREKPFREKASLYFLNNKNRKISVRSWGKKENPNILLSHGWGGRSTQFHAFIQPLVDAGYHVIGFEIPGHGDSQGNATNMIDVASIIKEVEQKEGNFEAIIGHSFGCATALLAMDKYQVHSKKLILIAYFSDVYWVTNLFGDVFSLKETTLQKMRQIALNKLSDNYGVTWSWEDISPLKTIKNNMAEILLIHDEKDNEVPLEQANLLVRACPKAKVITTSGLGHRKILMSKKVVTATLDFINP